MARIVFKDKQTCIEVEKGIKLSECIRKAGFAIETPCNCIGICGKCKVKAVGFLSPPTAEELKFVDEKSSLRLACLAKVEGDVEIELLKEEKALKTINRGYAIDVPVDSGIKKVLLPAIDRKSAVPYERYMGYTLSTVELYEKIDKLERNSNDTIQGVVYKDRLMDLGEGFSQILGIAVDIGTTGISAYLVNLETGEVLDKVSCLNPQTQFGGDVLSRISYCIEHEQGILELKRTILNCMNEIVEGLVGDQYNKNQIYRMIIAGNTTMLHLFLGVHPISIAKAPYRSIFLRKLEVAPEKLHIDINQGGTITLLPSASGYVGADILSGIVATAFDERKDTSIFIDIGTNGEIVAIADGKMAATSTAAGPALEGMNISCGCRAEEGAIDAFHIDEDFQVHYTTIGGNPAKGICGSGLIDIAAALVRKKIVLESGKFNPNPDPRIQSRIQDKKFYVTNSIAISQKDIRQIQLAKGAIATGVTMLLKEIGVAIEDVKEAVIAGAFGYHLNADSILEISLIPKGFKGKITFVGNSSVEGARLALVSEPMLEKMERIQEQVQVLELSVKEEFQKYFIQELNF